MVPSLLTTMTWQSRTGKAMETSVLTATVGSQLCPHWTCLAAGHPQAPQVSLQEYVLSRLWAYRIRTLPSTENFCPAGLLIPLGCISFRSTMGQSSVPSTLQGTTQKSLFSWNWTLMYSRTVFCLFTWAKKKNAFTFTMRIIDSSILACMPKSHLVSWRLKVTIFVSMGAWTQSGKERNGVWVEHAGLHLLGLLVISYERVAAHSLI